MRTVVMTIDVARGRLEQWQIDQAGDPRQQNVTTTDGQNVTTVDGTDFDAERPRLTTIAARIPGSVADADDGLQEAWLRRL